MNRVPVKGLVVLVLVLAFGMVTVGGAGALPVNASGPAVGSDPVTPSPDAGGSGRVWSDVRPHDLHAVNAADANDGSMSKTPASSPLGGPRSSSPADAGSGGFLRPGETGPDRTGSDGSGAGQIFHNLISPIKTIKSGTIPSAVSRQDGLIDLFYYNETNFLYTAGATVWENPEWPWEYRVDPVHTGNNYLFSPGACSAGPDHLAVFVVNDANGLYELDWTGSWGSWSGDLSGTHDANSSPACVSRFPGNIELVYQNKSGYLIHRSKNAATWSAAEKITFPGPLNEGASIISTSSDGFDIIAHRPVYNLVYTLHWDEPSGWDLAWNTTDIPAYSFVGASTRNADAQGTRKYIDIMHDPNGMDHWTWNVSKDGGVNWHPEPYAGSGTGLLEVSGSAFTIVSPHHNRVEFYQEWAEKIYGDIFLTPSSDMIGVFRPSTHVFYQDFNGNGVWNGALTDRSSSFGITGDTPIAGDWNGNGTTEIGVFRNSTHMFYEDVNGNGAWNGALTDKSSSFGITGDIPVTGDWTGDVKTEIGVYRPSTHLFYLDWNGNGVWNGALTDKSCNFGITGDIPITGDWDGDGITEIGVYRPSTHLFYEDYNGNGVWNGAVVDRSYTFGITGDIPITGDWNSDARTDIGVYRPSTHLFYEDYNGNGVWNGALIDRSYTFGITGDVPVTGAW